jgi:mono/diheme cytochrome c family protein
LLLARLKLATASLAVICARDVRWHAITQGSALFLHGYQACDACHGKGIVFATGDNAERAWDPTRNRWVS